MASRAVNVMLATAVTETVIVVLVHHAAWVGAASVAMAGVLMQ